MRKSHVIVGVLLLVSAVLAVGCAKPPQQEIDASKAALTAAEQAEAQGDRRGRGDRVVIRQHRDRGDESDRHSDCGELVSAPRGGR